MAGDRRRRTAKGLTTLLLLIGAGCTDRGPGPAADPIEGAAPPERVTEDGTSVVRNSGAQERLRRYERLPARRVRLLFLNGRAASPLEGGGSAFPDHDNSRVVVFDDRGVVDRVLQGRAPDGRRLETPAFVARVDDGFLAVEDLGDGLYFRDGDPVEWRLGTGALSGGSSERLARTRTVFDIPLQPIPPGEPLLWRGRGPRETPVGSTVAADEPLLSSLVNSGWVATTDEGATYFASAVRPEVHRYSVDGALEWIARWTPPVEIREPRFRVVDGGLTPDFKLVQQAMTVDDGGRAWILSPGEELGEPEDRILVFDRGGVLLREGRVPINAAVYTDDAGRLYATAPDVALARTEETTRDAFPPFDLPELGGEGRYTLADFEGRVTVVNFWASWCAPCRKEMPQLDEWARTLAPGDVAVVGINEDVAARDGLRFLEELGGVAYPVAEGGGRQREVYRYRGLPYTVVLDRQGRIVRSFYGFGSSIAPIVSAVEDELEGSAR